jgi:hypothetical protein
MPYKNIREREALIKGTAPRKRPKPPASTKPPGPEPRVTPKSKESR